MALFKFFGMMVARDGVEPPTPAFSGIYKNLTGLRWLRKSLKIRERCSVLGLRSWAGIGFGSELKSLDRRSLPRTFESAWAATNCVAASLISHPDVLFESPVQSPGCVAYKCDSL